MPNPTLSPEGIALAILESHLTHEGETLTRLRAERAETFARMCRLDARIVGTVRHITALKTAFDALRGGDTTREDLK